MENHDGFAIQHTANAFFRDYGTYDRKIMFVISDGQPAGSNYGGSRARKHMRKVADACRSKLGVEVYGIGIDSAYENATGNEMYGQGNFVVLQDVTSSLPIMARFVRQVAMSMKK
jgi:nitric oxide reductase activation protein